MRFLQLTSKTRLIVGDPGECEEAIFEVTRQERAVLQVLERPLRKTLPVWPRGRSASPPRQRWSGVAGSPWR
jgi:hypothetical protein